MTTSVYTAIDTCWHRTKLVTSNFIADQSTCAHTYNSRPTNFRVRVVEFLASVQLMFIKQSQVLYRQIRKMSIASETHTSRSALAEMRNWSHTKVSAANVDDLNTVSLAGLPAAFLVNFDERDAALFVKLKSDLISHLSSYNICGCTVASGITCETIFLEAVSCAIDQVQDKKAREGFEKRATEMYKLASA